MWFCGGRFTRQPGRFTNLSGWCPPTCCPRVSVAETAALQLSGQWDPPRLRHSHREFRGPAGARSLGLPSGAPCLLDPPAVLRWGRGSPAGAPRGGDTSTSALPACGLGQQELPHRVVRLPTMEVLLHKSFSYRQSLEHKVANLSVDVADPRCRVARGGHRCREAHVFN